MSAFDAHGTPTPLRVKEFPLASPADGAQGARVSSAFELRPRPPRAHSRESAFLFDAEREVLRAAEWYYDNDVDAAGDLLMDAVKALRLARLGEPSRPQPAARKPRHLAEATFTIIARLP